jgi:hypothetical protein
MKYFRLSEWYIKWELSWENFSLYLSSIPFYEDEPVNRQLETVDVNDVFS